MAKKETPTPEEINEIKALCYSAKRGMFVDVKRIGVLWLKYPVSFGRISDEECLKARDVMRRLGGAF